MDRDAGLESVVEGGVGCLFCLFRLVDNFLGGFRGYSEVFDVFENGLVFWGGHACDFPVEWPEAESDEGW